MSLEAVEVSLSYGDTPAVSGVSLRLEPGSRTALMGPSGCGKSSLLHILCGVLRPDSGQVLFDGRDLTAHSERQRSRLRMERFGVVFQFGGMVPELTLVENVGLPWQLLGHPKREARDRALVLLDKLGISDVAGSRAGAVSGGQAQRAAVARALVHEPSVVLADEPTGSLDTVNAEAVLDAMVLLTGEIGSSLLVVTHDNQVAAQLDSVITMHDGALGGVGVSVGLEP